MGSGKSAMLELCQRMTATTIPAGAPLYSQGERCTKLFVVVRGAVRLDKRMTTKMSMSNQRPVLWLELHQVPQDMALLANKQSKFLAV